MYINCVIVDILRFSLRRHLKTFLKEVSSVMGFPSNWAILKILNSHKDLAELNLKNAVKQRQSVDADSVVTSM